MALGLGVLAWLLFSGAIDWSAIGRLLTTRWVLPAAACLCLGNFTMTAWRLRVLMEAQDLRLPFASAFQLTVTAAFFSWCIPGGTGGDLVKMYFLGRWNPGKITEAVTITLWDRAIGLATFLMLALIAAAFVPSLVMSEPVVAGLLGTCAVALLVGAALLALALYTDWSQRWPLRTLEHLGRPGQTILRMFRVMHGYRRRPVALLSGVVLSLCAQACLLGTAFTLATVVTDSGARPIMLVLMPMGWVTNALPISPGGLGVGEAALEALFKLVGLSGGAAVSLSWRAVAMVMSLPGFWFYLRGRKAAPKAGHAAKAPGLPKSG
ncbi:MAG: flippase-like domain-containing protein [Phycisphaerae bacterium]|nr:flippase-like domain-containing protein [Phycisphaerae bacterium]